ncbi:MAG TPA: transketolase family protein, partial [Marmoricola sp.]|nr:transketolase family protein [Marmoricola sp.]
RLQTRTLPDGWDTGLPEFPASTDGSAPSIATRKASGTTIQALAQRIPELWGGSADLAESNNTTIDGSPSFVPESRSTKMWSGNPFLGRVLHFGIREHGMGAIMNGIAAHGGSRVFGGTFLAFSDYMRGAVRLAALMKLPTIYVWTHDSIGLGEDGPTHQPVEHLAALRAIPGLDIVRPADANETVAAWAEVLKRNDRPAGLILTRQNVPVFPRGENGFADISQVGRGAYVLLDTPGTPDVILMGTGSEVQLLVSARAELADKGIAARVVSMPCLEWFAEQDADYRDSVLPPEVSARVSVEAGIAQGWHRWVGDNGRCVSLEHFGASANFERLFEEFGITSAAVCAAALDSIQASKA